MIHVCAYSYMWAHVPVLVETDIWSPSHPIVHFMVHVCVFHQPSWLEASGVGEMPLPTPQRGETEAWRQSTV